MLKAFATVGSATLLSRILGFIRDILIADSLGSGPIADAFFVAFRFPNLFRRIFAEGAFNAAFVPLFTDKLAGEGIEAARQYAGQIFSSLTTILLLLTALLEIFMPFFMMLNAPGFVDNTQQFEWVTLYSRIMFPFLACMSITAMFSGMLNAKGYFATAAFAPVIMNIILVALLLMIEFLNITITADIAYMLSWGVLISGGVQVIFVSLSIRKHGLGFRLHRPRFGAPFSGLLRLAIPGIIAGGITQINIFIGTIIASQKDGVVSYLYYADRLYQLPLGVIGIAMGVVILPLLTRHLKNQDMAKVRHQLDRSIELAMLFTLPAAVALFIIPDLLISILFERGAFDKTSTLASAEALRYFALGLPAFVLIKIFSSGFFAAKDTRSPMYFALASAISNIALSLILFPSLEHAGIAIATSVSGWLNALLLIFTIRRKIDYRPALPCLFRVFRILMAAIAMGALLNIFNQSVLASQLYMQTLILKIAGLGLLMVLAILSYFIAVFISGAFRMSDMKAILKKQW